MAVIEVTAPDGRVIEIEGDRIPTEAELQQIFAQLNAKQPLDNAVPEAGENVIDPQTELKRRLDRLPELGQGGLLGGENQAKVAAITPVLLTTTDPQEIAQIITTNFPNVGMVMSPPDENGHQRIILRNNETGAAVEVNKPGISQLDILQFLGIGAAFIPSGGLAQKGASIAAKGALGALGTAGTQAVMEAGQALAGGEFDTTDVAIAGAAGGLAELGAGALAKRAASKALQAEQKAKALQAAIKGEVAPELGEEAQKAIAESIRQGDVEKLVSIIKPDEEFFKAADEIGISTAPIAAFASRNPQFRNLSGALQAVPGSVIDAQAKAFMKDLANTADDLIARLGSSIDKAGIDDELKTQITSQIRKMEKAADKAYDALGKIIPKRERVEPRNTLEFLNDFVADLGGESEAPAYIRRIFRELQNSPTFGKLQLIRRELGKATQAGAGRFKDAETGLAKKLYGLLKKDEAAFAEQVGGDAAKKLLEGANGIVARRKVLEDQAVQLLGKDLSGSVIGQTTSALRALEKGGIGKFKKIISNLPKESRQKVVLSALDNIIGGTGEFRGLSPTKAANFFTNILRQKQARDVFFNSLDEPAQKALKSLAKVAIGVSRAQKDVVRTGVTNTLFNKDASFLRKMIGEVAQKARLLSPSFSGFDVSVIGKYLKQDTDAAKKAADFLGSPEFLAYLRQAVKDGVFEGNKASKELLKLEAKAARAKVFKKWAEAIEKSTGKNPAAVGLTRYLFEEE